MCGFVMYQSDYKRDSKVGDRHFSIYLNYRYGELLEFSADEMETLDDDGKGGGMAQSRASFNCFNSEVAIPGNYQLWKLYPDADREYFERKEFGGKTLQELKKEGKYRVGYLDYRLVHSRFG
jgi:hypothetical protein